jgi:hypothetical protein
MRLYSFEVKYFPILYSVVFVVQSVVGFAQQESSDQWKLKKEKNGITVFTRLMEGSKFKEYKSVCELSATPQQLHDLLLDVKTYTKWMDRVIHAEIVETNGEDVFYVYSEVKVPWPFDNRDQITKSVVKRDTVTGAIAIEVTIIPDYMPEKKGVIRLPSGRGSWVFTPKENGMTEAYHWFGGDPGGNIPAWIMNMFLVEGPYNTMMGMQQMISTGE